MWQAVGSLYGKGLGAAPEVDIRVVVERFYSEQLGGNAVTCDKVTGAQIVVRVSNAAIAQEAQLLEADLKHFLRAQAGFEMDGLKVRFG